MVRLVGIRKHLLARCEQEQRDARDAWRKARSELHDLKCRWRQALEDAKQQWIAARAEFFQMRTTSGQFKRHKAVYQRMKDAAAQLHLDAREAVPVCREAGRVFFVAVRRVAEAKMKQEKLNFMREELRAQNRPTDN